MYRLNSRAVKQLNKVFIDETDLEQFGLYLKKDYVFEYVISKEVETISIPGRDMPYHRVHRNLPIELEITFNIKESIDFNKRYDRLEEFIGESTEKSIRLNQENTGFKIYYVELRGVTRGIGQDTITIYFMCYPEVFPYSE